MTPTTPPSSLAMSRGTLVGWVLVLASTVAFSLVTPVGKAVIAGGAAPLLVLGLRFWTGTGLLALTLALLAPQQLRIDRRGFAITFVAGVVNGLGASCFFLALRRLDASIAVMLFALSPLAVLGALWLRGEPLTRRHLVRLGLGLIGVYLLIGPGGHADWIGIGLVLLAIVGYTIELVSIQWFLQAYDIRTVTLYILLGMACGISLMWAALGATTSSLAYPVWPAVLFLGVVCTYFAWWAMFTGIRELGTAQVALLSPLETLLSVGWSFWLLGERFDLWQWAGAVFILLSAVLASRRLTRVRVRIRWRAWMRP